MLLNNGVARSLKFRRTQAPVAITMAGHGEMIQIARSRAGRPLKKPQPERARANGFWKRPSADRQYLQQQAS
jgi:hypothetical protein